MTKPGPKPAPTALKLVRGTRKDRVNQSEPIPPDGEVRPPEYLTEDALTIWNRLAPSLIKRGVLTPWDIDSFAAYCTAVIHHREAVAAVTSVMIHDSDHGRTVKHPALQVVRDQVAIITQLASRFGLDPSSRSQLDLGKNDEPRRAERLLS